MTLLSDKNTYRICLHLAHSLSERFVRAINLGLVGVDVWHRQT